MKKYSDKQKVTIAIVMFSSFISTFMGSALNLSIPDIGNDFRVSASILGWIVAGYMLSAAVFSVPFGRLADITQKRRIFVMGLLFFSLTSLLTAFAFNFTMMMALRVVQGIGGAMMFSTATAILLSAFPASEKGQVIGYSTSTVYIGLSVGPVAGGLLNHYLGWPSIFIITAAISGLVFIIAAIKLPQEEGKGQFDSSFDLSGNILYIVMITLLMFGLSEIAVSKYATVIVILGAVLAVFFVRHELKIEKPIIQIRLFTGNIAYTFSNLAALLNYGATGAIGYLLSIYLQVAMGYSSQAAGFILISQPIIMAIVTSYAGRLSDRVSPYKIASIGMGICVAGLLFFVFITASYPLWLIVLALVVTGAGFGLFASPNTNAVMSCVEPKDYGVASSILATMRSLGHMLSMAIVVLVVRMYLGNAALSEAAPEVLIETMRTLFIIFMLICIIGIFFSAMRKKNGGKNGKDNM